MDVLKLKAVLGLDKSEFDSGLDHASGKMGSFGSAVGKGLKTVATVGAAAMGAAATAVTGFAAASVKTGMDFDSSMSQVVATMGYSVDELNTKGSEAQQTMEKLRGFAQEMGATTAFSATEAADALNYMALAGYDAETSMKMLPNVLNLAAAGGFDLARASDMVTDTQTAFGLSLDRTSQMVDEMAKAASTGNTSVEQLGDAFLVVGGLAKELNGGMIMMSDGTHASTDGVQELEIALTAMANAGIKGSEAGTHMRNMLLKLSSPTAEGTKQLEALGVKVFDTEGNMNALSDIMLDLSTAMDGLTQEKKLQAISEIFNTRDVASAEALMAAVGEDWAAIGESILDAEGAAAAMAGVQLNNLAGDITLFKSALEGVKIAVSDNLKEPMREFVQTTTNGLSDVTSKLKEGDISGAFDAIGETLASLVFKVIDLAPKMIAAGGRLIVALVKGIANNIPSVAGQMREEAVKLMEKLSDGIKNFDIRGAIRSVADSIVAFFDGDGVQQMMNAGVKLIVNLATGLFKALPEIVVAAGRIIGSLVGSLAEALVTNLPDILELGANILAGIVEGIGLAIGMIGQVLVDVFNGIVNGFKALFGIQSPSTVMAELGGYLVEGVLEGLSTLIESVLGIFTDLYEGLVAAWEGIKSKASEVFAAIKDAVSARWDELKAKTDAVWNAVKAFLASAVTAIQTKITTVITAVKVFLENTWNTIKTTAETVWNNIKTFLSTLWDSIKTKVETVFNAIKTFLDTTWNNIKSAAVTAWNNIKKEISDKIDAIKKYVEDTLNKMKEAISKIWDNIKSTVVTKWNEIKTEISGKIDAIKELFKLDNFKDLGKNIIGGILAGLKEAASTLIEYAQSLVGSIIGVFTNGLKMNSPSRVMRDKVGVMISRGIAVGIADGAPEIYKAIDSINNNLAAEEVQVSGVNRGANAMNGFTQNVTINAPTELSPSEVARQTKIATQNMVLSLRMA